MTAKLAIGAGALLLALAAGFATALTLRDAEDDGPRIVLASAIDPETGAPLDDLETVPAGATELYATLAVDDVPAGTQFRFEWSHRRGGVGRADGSFAFSGLEIEEPIDDGWVYTRLDIPEGLPAGGDFNIEVSRQGGGTERREFEVTE